MKDINDYKRFEVFYEPEKQQRETDKERLESLLEQQRKPQPQSPFSMGEFSGSGLFKPVK
jgi:hypothetical protein